MSCAYAPRIGGIVASNDSEVVSFGSYGRSSGTRSGRRFRRSGAVGAFALVLTMILAALVLAPRVSGDGFIRDLGTLYPSEPLSSAYGINQAGQIAGTSQDDDGRFSHGFVWDNGTMTDIGSLGGAYTAALGINDAGQVVGRTYNASGYARAFLWESGAMTDLNIGTDSLAWDINNRAQVVGRVGTTTGYHAFLWENGTTTDLGTLGGVYSVAYQVNDVGQVVGSSTDASGTWHPFIWENGAMNALAIFPNDTGGEALGINDAGQIVGWSLGVSGSDTYWLALLWENGTPSDLGNLGRRYSQAWGINGAGQIVGRSNGSAFIWETGTMESLGGLRGGGSQANAVNDAGQIAGWSEVGPGGYNHAVLWNRSVGPIHDVAATLAVAYPKQAVVGDTVYVTGQVENQGTRTETFNVSAFAGSILIGTSTVTNLTPSAAQYVSFSWDTSGVPPDSYQIQIEASHVQNETDLSDNTVLGSTVAIHPPLSAYASVNPAQTDVRIVVSFTCSSIDWGPPFGAISYAWDFGDGGTASGDTATHSYESAGLKTATCLASEDGGGNTTSVVQVQVNPQPSVTASVDLPNASPGTPITFDATTTGGSGDFSYNWGFGDGSSTEGSSVSHAYSSSGQYTAIVTVRDTVGGTASNTVTVTISAGASPLESQSSALPSATDVGLAMYFSCSASGGTPPYAYAWEFGDGSQGSGATVAHAYASSGSMTATCTVTDDAGKSTISTTTVQVYPVPTVTATVDSPNASPGMTLTFTAAGAGGSGEFTYSWGFGDGISATGATVEHAYEKPGQYTAVVTVQDSAGGTAPNTVGLTVTVSYVSAIALLSTTAVITGDSITFSAIAVGGSGGPYTFSWDFGDGSKETGPTTTHAYSLSGSYTPKLTATDSSGSTVERVLATITVRSPTVAPQPSGTSLDPAFFAIWGIVAVAGVAALAAYALRRNRPKP